MEKMLVTYILFSSHTDGLLLEKILKRNNLKYTIVPTPRELSQCCGISIKISPQIKSQIEKILRDNPDIKVEGIYTIERRKRRLFDY